MKEILAIILILIPLLWELANDYKGDTNKGIDVFLRFAFAAASAGLVTLITKHNFWLAFNLSLAIHWLLFDYLIHIILYRNGVIVSPEWFKYTGKSSKVDNLPIWKSIGPYGRLFVKLFYFLLAVWLYFKF